MVTDLPRFARPFTDVAAAPGKRVTKLLFSRHVAEAKFQFLAKLQLPAKFQVQVNLLQAQRQVEVELQEEAERQAEPAAE